MTCGRGMRGLWEGGKVTQCDEQCISYRMLRELFVELPTSAEIIAMESVDDYLIAFTDDGVAWVIDEHGTILNRFTREGNC